MKAYILKDEDFEKLIDKIEKKREHGSTLTVQEQMLENDIYRFFNYHIRVWMDEVKK